MTSLTLPPRGTRITMHAAHKKYGVSVGAVRNWRDAGWVHVLEWGGSLRAPCILDERDVGQVLLDRQSRPGRDINPSAREAIGATD